MTVRYRLIFSQELDTNLIERWRSIQSGLNAFQSPYFCPEFTQLVSRVRQDVRVVVIENGNRTVGFFPHQRTSFGVGRPVGGPLTDFQGVIAEPNSCWRVKELIRAAKLSAWTFDHLVDESAKFAPYVTMIAESPQIDLSGGFEQYLRTLRKPPQDFARKARKLARDVGPLTFTFHDSESSVMDCVIAWKSEQYRRTGLVNAFGAQWPGALLRSIMNVQEPGFAGVCSVLRAGKHIVAVHAGMRSRRVLHWWFPTYAQRFAQYSPGIVLLFKLAEALVSKGLHTIDLGKGNDAYKRSVMTCAAELQEGFVELPSVITAFRQLRRAADACAARGGLAALARLPLRVIRRIERNRAYR